MSDCGFNIALLRSVVKLVQTRHEISPRIRGFPRILTFLKKNQKKNHHLELQCNETEQVIYIIPSKCCSKMH